MDQNQLKYEIITLKNALAKEKEKLTRIKSKLKIEYQDFMSAKDTEMSIDLGENMRDQLAAIFRILQSEGVTF